MRRVPTADAVGYYLSPFGLGRPYSFRILIFLNHASLE
jgi:hypothetical protein